MTLRNSIHFASIAARTAAHMVFDRDGGKRFLVEALASGGPGIAPKFAQFLAARIFSGNEPDTIMATPRPVPIEVIKSIINDECANLAKEIDSIEESGITASLGQVHRALLKDGREVAIKVQRPGAKEAVSSELNLLLKAVSWSPVAQQAFDFNEWESWLRQRLSGELDYLEEARQQQLFYEHFSSNFGIVIPRPLLHFSTSSVLTQEWEESKNWTALSAKPAQFQSVMLERLSDFVVRSIFEIGIVQTDLQPANMGWRSDPGTASEIGQLILYDFGATMPIPKNHLDAIAAIIKDALLGKEADYFSHFCAMGFSHDLLAPIQFKFNKLCQNIMSPLVDPAGFMPINWRLSEMIERDLGEDKWIFRTAGPPWFMYMMRMLFGFFHASSVLKIGLPLRSRFESAVAFYSSENRTSFGAAAEPVLESDSSNYLQVEVLEGGNQVVSLQMPARAVGDLENLVTNETRLIIEKNGVDLRTIKERALQSGLRPQTLFEAEIGNRRYRVWLRR